MSSGRSADRKKNKQSFIDFSHRMIDFGKIRFDGELNVQNGLRFYVSSRPRIVSFLIETIGVRKRKIRVNILQEPNHERPHVHLDSHKASFAIDNGELLAGHCDGLTQSIIRSWIRRHRSDLLQLWKYVQEGGEYHSTLTAIREDKDFEDFGFTGKVPKYKKVINGVLIWHNDKLTIETLEDKITKVVCDGNLYVGVPYGIEDEGITFESHDGKVIVKKLKSV